jgi:O-antigen/teichoic acid export membrane protein
LGYESAVVLPKSDHASANIIALSGFLSLAFFAVLSLTALLAGSWILPLLEVAPDDQGYFTFLPLVVFVNALANVLVLWNNRKLLFKVNSYYRVSLSLGLALLSILFGYYSNPLNGMILAFLLTNIAFSGLFVVYTWRTSLFGRVKFEKREISAQARAYSQFPKYYLVQNFFDSFRENVFVFIINLIFSVGILGAYSFALRIIRVPLTLISSSVSQVAFQKISALRNENGDVLRFVYKLITILFLVSIPMALIFVFFGRELFIFVFGSQWGEAGSYTKLMAIWLFSNFISSPVSTVPLIFGKAKFAFYYSIGFNVLSTLVFYFCSVQTGNFELSLLITSVSSGLFLLFYVYQITELIKREQV